MIPASAFEFPYHYVPTEWICALFVSFFGLSAALHAIQSVYYRVWWLLPTACLSGVIEVLGWSARLWSSISPSLLEPFEIQITATIIGPTPLLAANFIIFGTMIDRLGACYSRLKPKWYSMIFMSFDIVSLVVQGIGGGMASTAAGHGKNPALGGHVMLAGIVFQLVVISVYSILAIEFFVRYLKNSPISRKNGDTSDERKERGTLDTRLKLMCLALCFNTLCLFIRAVYRTVELSDGWSGHVISTQVYFNVLDGAMITLAIFTLNFAHPSIFLNQKKIVEEEPYVYLDHLKSGKADA